MAGGRPTALENGVRSAQKRADMVVKLLNRVGDEIKVDANLGKKIRHLSEEEILSCAIQIALKIETDIPSLRETMKLVDALEEIAEEKPTHTDPEEGEN